MNKIYKIYLMPFISRKRKQKDVEDESKNLLEDLQDF